MSRSRTRPRTVAVRETIARGLRPVLRNAIQGLETLSFARDPLGGPGWVLHLPGGHRIDVVVMDDPSLHLSIRGTRVDASTGRTSSVGPLRVAVDPSKMAPIGGVVIVMLWTLYGELMGLASVKGAQTSRGSGTVSPQHADPEAEASSLERGQAELVEA